MLTAWEAFSFDLEYVDYTEGLAQCKKDTIHLATGQKLSLSRLGYKMLPVIEHEPLPRLNEVGH